VDDILLRDRDTTGNGTLDERLYGMQDANWNVSSIASAGGVVQERYGYHPYGTPIVLTDAFAFGASSNFDWETMFAGYRWDGAVMLFQVRNRVYATAVGSWLQRDPANGGRPRSFHVLGTSLYVYASNRPTVVVDPEGRVDWCALASRSDIQCICGPIQAVDSIFGVLIPPEIGWLLDIADCVCDIASFKADLCAGCLNVPAARWMFLIASCAADWAQVFGAKRSIALWMVEFITWYMTVLSAGGGFGQTGYPVWVHHCEDWLGIDVTGVPPNQWPFRRGNVIGTLGSTGQASETWWETR
jgi:RHS repeat-associated protein